MKSTVFTVGIKWMHLNPQKGCNLPHNIVKKHINADTNASKYVRVTGHNTSIYVIWTGGISSTLDIEMPNSIETEPLFRSCQTVVITIEDFIPTAQDICLKPCSSYDWDIVSTQACVIENNLLRSKHLVYVGEVLKINVTPSVVANLLVKSISCVGDGSSGEVGKLTNQSSLVIEPYSVARSSSSSGSSSVMTNNKSGSDVTKIRCPPMSCESLLKEMNRGGQEVWLRVLPERFSAVDTSYCGRVESTRGCEGAGDDLHGNASQQLSEDYLEALLLSDDDINVDASHCFPNISHRVCAVHPLFLDCLIHRVLAAVPPDDQRSHHEEVTAAWIAVPSRYKQCFPALLFKCDSASAQAAVADVSPVVMVSVVTSERVRPGYMALSASARQTLRPSSGDVVRLELLSEAQLQPTVPPCIKLTPVDWSLHSVEAGQRNEAQLLEWSSMPYTLFSSFLRWVENQQLGGAHIVLIHDKQVISLPIAATSSEPQSAHCQQRDFLLQVGQDVAKESKHSSEVKALPDHVVLDRSSAHYHSVVDRLLAAMVVGSKAVHLTAGAEQQAHQNLGITSSPTRITGLESTVRQLVGEVVMSILPQAVQSRLRADVKPSTAVLLTGASGCGKSTLMGAAMAMFAESPRVLAHTYFLDCCELQSLAVEKALTKLTDLFVVAQSHSPAILCLDNVQSVCPAAAESGAGTLKDERCNLISLHLERLLRGNHERQQKGHDAAVIALETKCFHWLPSGHCDSDHCMDIVLSLALSKSVFVIASAPSVAAIQSRLLLPDCLRKVLEVNSVSSKDRVRILIDLLTTALVEVPTLSARETEQLESITEGFCLPDLVSFSKRVCAVAYWQSSSASRRGQSFSASFDDMAAAAKSFVPSSSSSAAAHSSASQDISWEDVGGFQLTKRCILDVIRLPILYRKLFQLSPVKMPRAILLFGPPGCGKTYIAQAAGKEFGMGFISVRGPQLLDKYIGASEKAVRDLFGRAKQTGRPTLIFFDEFESLAPKRGKDNTGITDRIVNQLLTFIDGVESNMSGGATGEAQVFIIAATSRPDLVDSALLRPGRIEKHLYVGLPSPEDRAAVLSMCLRRLPNSEYLGETVQWVAQQAKAERMTAADFKAVVNTAFLIATHEIIDSGDSESGALTSISAAHLMAAFEQTRPSVSEQDMRFYDSVHNKFQPLKSGKESSKVDISNQKMIFH